jgi:Zn-dependent peptidase ImmA (M78 family)/transcriptional regulator with XRE-family HTH domain
MNSRTPGFSGARLREAREVRSWQQAFLAEVVGVSAQAISKYERGGGTPSPEVVEKLALHLNVPPAFFLMPERPVSDRRVFYRSMSAATKTARTRAEHRASWLSDLICYVSAFVELPSVNVPDFSVVPANPLELEDADIEHIAADARTYWGMREEPIGNVVTLMENQGVVVARDYLGAATLDSLSEYDRAAERPLVIIGTDKGTPARWRFDAAHELGHLILHRRVDRKRLKNLAEHKAIEDQAHRFASSFLLPRAPFCEELFAASLDAMLALKARWRTSIAMMIMRARQTDMISDTTERRLWINYSRRGWRRREPLDDSMEQESPRLLLRSFELIFEAGAQTTQNVVTSTGLPALDIESLAGLPERFLERGSAAPVALKLAVDLPENVTPFRRRD